MKKQMAASFIVASTFISTIQGQESQPPSKKALQKHHQAVKEIESLGGTYHDAFPGWAGNPSHCDLRKWKGKNYGQVSNLIGLQMIWLENINDDALEEIDVSQLKFLRLINGQFTNQGFADFISKTPKLERVTLIASSGIADEGLESLTKLQHLQDLELLQIPITDAGIKKLPLGLQMLCVRQAKVSTACFTDIAKMKNMEFLYLGEVKKIGDEEVKILAKLDKLRVLEIKSSQLTNEGLKTLATLSNLEALQVGGGNITDEGLMYLKDLNKLHRLFIYNAQCTPQGLINLRRVIWRDDELETNHVWFDLPKK